MRLFSRHRPRVRLDLAVTILALNCWSCSDPATEDHRSAVKSDASADTKAERSKLEKPETPFPAPVRQSTLGQNWQKVDSMKPLSGFFATTSTAGLSD